MKLTGAHVAHHEAGHYVAQRYLLPDSGTIRLSIVRDRARGTLGHHAPLEGPPEHVRRITTRDRAQLERLGVSGRSHISYFKEKDVIAFAVCSYAGAAAELRFDPSNPERVKAGARADDAYAAALLGSEGADGIPGIGRPELESSCRTRAARFVDRHWQEIEGIAAELLRLREMDGEVAQALLDVINRRQVQAAAGALSLRLGIRRTSGILGRHGYTLARRKVAIR